MKPIADRGPASKSSSGEPVPTEETVVVPGGDDAVDALAGGQRDEPNADRDETILLMAAGAAVCDGGDEFEVVVDERIPEPAVSSPRSEAPNADEATVLLRRRLLETRVFFMILVLGLFGMMIGVTRHQSRTLGHQESLRRAHAAAQELALHNLVTQLRSEQRTAIASGLEAEAERTREQVNRLSETVRLENEELLEERLGDLESALEADDDPRIAELAREISGLRTEVHSNAPAGRVFQEILEQNDSSVVLLYTSFDYVVDTPGGPVRRNSTGWGTGFFVSEEGRILTNKHVVQPWKFDPKYASLQAMGIAHVDPDSMLICAWPGGTSAIGEGGEPDLTRGFNNGPLGNLRFVRTAPDEMESTDVATPSGAKLSAPMHSMSNADLAILCATSTFPIRPVNLKTSTGPDEIDKLEPIMVIGFPRGRGILETRIAETSPSMGTVRKVEDTIYVTASIIPGNSGGPVFTADGEVIGVATRVYSETLGACIRIEHALALLKE